MGGRPSTPLLGLLVGVVIFGIVYFVALKPSSSSNSNTGGVGQLQPAINAAHNAVTIASNQATTAATESASTTTASTSASTTPTATTPTTTTATTPTTTTATSTKTKGKKAVKHAAQPTRAKPHPAPAQTTAQRVATIARALNAHKVLAVLFYNPRASDDQAVRHELETMPLHNRRLVTLSVPIADLSHYSIITTSVPVTVAPTIVIINRHDQASTIVGYTSTFEIEQRITDALAA